MPPHQDLSAQAAAPESKPTPAPRVASRAQPGGPAATRGPSQPPGGQPLATPAAPEQKRDRAAEGRFAPAPTAPPPPVELGLSRQQGAADAEPERAVAGEVGGVVSQEAASPEKIERMTPRPAVAAEPASPMTSAAGTAREATPASLKAQGDALRRLEAARPRTAAGWRWVREQWKALAAAETDPVRADEARVRAIVAAREAWLAEGDAGDEAAFRAEAESYLRRDDARQKPRVEGLLAEAAPRTP